MTVIMLNCRSPGRCGTPATCQSTTMTLLVMNFPWAQDGVQVLKVNLPVPLARPRVQPAHRSRDRYWLPSPQASMKLDGRTSPLLMQLMITVLWWPAALRCSVAAPRLAVLRCATGCAAAAGCPWPVAASATPPDSAMTVAGMTASAIREPFIDTPG